MVINTLAQLWYYYSGMAATWLGGVAGLIYVGYKLNESVQSKGGWKAWKRDLFGMEDYK